MQMNDRMKTKCVLAFCNSLLKIDLNCVNFKNTGVFKERCCLTLREKCPYSELLWSVLSCIRTEFEEISISPYSVQMQEIKIRTRITPNTDTFYPV